MKDTSGAVLPGVTVEASSPVLIEKTRSTVTDGSGAYQIIHLLPGTYTVTFTLPGFNTFKRDQIELSGSFVATVNADMRVGDAGRNDHGHRPDAARGCAKRGVQKVVTKEIVDAIPTGRLGINLAALQPGIILGAGGGVGQANTNALTSQDVGGTAGDTFTDLAIHGGKPAEQRQTIGGLSAATTIRFGESLSSSPSFTAMQEMTVNTSGADASLAGGGVQINYVPARRRQHLQGADVLQRRERRDAGHATTRRHRGRNRRLHAGREPVLPRPHNAARRAEERLRRQSGIRRSDHPGQAVVVLRRRDGPKAENYVPNNYPNMNFVAGQTSPTLLNTTTLTYNPATNEDLRTTLGGGGNFWEQTMRLTWQMNAEEQARHLLQQQEARRLLNATDDDVAGSAESVVLLPVLRQPGPVVGADDQQAAARSGLLAPSGNVGRQARADSTWPIRWPSASRTTTRRRWYPATCS